MSQQSMDIQNTQGRIKNITEGYKRLFPEEYKATVEFIKQNRRLQDNEFASLKKEQNLIERALFEIPEKLMNAIVKELSDVEMKYFKSKKGSRWFAKTFPEFSLATKI